jgi:hypothetical protein
METDCSENSSQLLSGSDNGSALAVFEYEKSYNARCAARATPGLYTVEVSVEWSNGYNEEHGIIKDLNAEPAQRYAILAYESGKGRRQLTDVKIHGYVSDFEKVATWVILAPVAIVYIAAIVVTLPFTIPAALIEGRRACVRPAGKPSKDCCYIWIEHRPTGNVVAGTAPLGGDTRPTEPKPIN